MEQARRAREVFQAIRHLSESQRREALERACGADDALRGAVRALLSADTADPTLTGPPPAPMAPALPGQGRIGHYHLKRVIASGGMGTVYEALQAQPRRPVAIKVMSHGIASRSALRRFEFEAQILARLRHPGIAQIYEAATHDFGSGEVPYFAMEYIPSARSITDYSRAHRLGVRQRLELFTRVCDAVHHGHQKGIIHRDLKPSNILVDTSGQPRIIDFGVARATDSDLALTTLQTDVGQLVGTLQYMSPEQCEADPHALDTRSDVYALGVVLYELLCERLPYDVHGSPVHEAARVIREQAPVRPSTVSAKLRGDVETIVLRALEKDRDRRYQSARELGADIDRYLHDEPIVARPPSMLYQLRKFARRNRSLVVGAAALVAVLAVSTVVTSLLAVGQARQRALADDARDDAGRQAAVARAVSDFLVSTLESADPNLRGPDVTVASVLLEGAPLIDEQFSGEPAVRLALHETYGRVLRALNLHRMAEAHLRSAVDIARESLPPDDPRRGELITALGIVLLDLGRDQEAGARFAEALETLGSSSAPGFERRADAEMALGFQLHDVGDYDEAEMHYRKALRLCRTRTAPSAQTGRCMSLLGWLLVDSADLEAAEPLVREGLAESRSVLGERHTQVAFGLMALAHLEQARGRVDEARRACEDAMGVYVLLGKTDILPRMVLAGVLEDAGRGAEAPSWDVRELGDLAPSAAINLRNRGRLMHLRGRPAEGDALLAESIRIDTALDEESDGARAPSIAHTRRVWGELLLAAARTAEAQEQLHLAFMLQGDQEGAVGRVPTQLAFARLAARSDPDLAQAMIDEALRLRTQRLPANAWPIAVVQTASGELLVSRGRYEEAQAILLHAHAVLETALGAADRRTLAAVAVLVALFEAWGRPQEAERYRGMLPGPSAPRSRSARG
jgi:serine/threonine protein kinase